MPEDMYAKWRRKLREIAENPPVPCNNASHIIVFDTETTGLAPDEGHDEILLISIIDGDGNTLLSSYVKPRWHDEWPIASSVNGITPQMVADAPTPEELIPIVKGIFASADTLVAYNAPFDLAFLDVWGIRPSEEQDVIDVMLDFAEIYGEWNDFFCSYKWQKLSTAAHFYGYEFDAHDSLEDARATLFVYKKILES